MPIYAYKCSACQRPHEALQRISDAPLLRCPACGADALVKQLTAAGFQLKGSGWYVTDFRNGGDAKPAAKQGEAGAPAPGATDAAAPAKDAPAKEAAPAAAPAKDAPAPASGSGGGTAGGTGGGA